MENKTTASEVAYRSGENLTMSCKGHLDSCWVSTQPIKRGRSLRPLREKVGEARMRGHSLFNLINPSPALRASSPARGEENSVRGFTLIELLVVVLIIGILAAVALPQYQRAVAKSRAMQGVALIKGLITSSEAYFLTYGEYPSSLDSLDIKAPGNWNGNKKIYTIQAADAKSNGEWSVVIQKGYGNPFTTTDSVHGIHVGQITGPYQGAGFSYIFNEKLINPNKKNIPTHKLYCSEFVRSDTPFKKEKGDFCVKLFGGKNIYDAGNYERYYEITKL